MISIQVDNLGKNFGSIEAVKGISFSVNKGDVLGFLGPNGAGKSTTMKLLTTFLLPTYGRAEVGGFDIVEQANEVRKTVGYLPENAPLYGEMQVRDFLNFIADVRKISGADRKKSIDRAIEQTSLSDVVNRRIEKLSKGFKRRVGLAQALLHDPKILILDEPTDGLDPNQKHEVRELIGNMSEEKTLIISTHILEEVEAVCNRVVIISNGQVVADDEPSELKKSSKNYGSLCVAFKQNISDEEIRKLNEIPGVEKVEDLSNPDGEGSKVRFIPSDKNNIASDVIVQIAKYSFPIEDIIVENGSLVEVFRDITNQEGN